MGKKIWVILVITFTASTLGVGALSPSRAVGTSQTDEQPALVTVAKVADSKEQKGFSFAVHGDSRSMLYLPYKKGQEERIHKLLVDVFSLVMPE